MNKKINVAVADDHDLVRKGIVSLLKEDPRINVAFDVSNGQELIDQLKKKSVDVIVLDLEMPVLDGREALEIIMKQFRKINVIVLSMHYSKEYIMDCMSVGAKGFLPKNSDIETLVEAIYKVNDNGFYVDGELSKIIFDHALNDKPIFESADVQLSSREIEVLQLICDGLLNKEIAENLNLSIRTVETHRNNIIKKANVSNVAGLMRFAVKKGYYTLNRH